MPPTVTAGVDTVASESSLPQETSHLELVEEPLLDEALLLLGRHFDIPGGEEKHFVGYALDATLQSVRESAREVDEPLGKLVVASLEVEDHRDVALELSAISWASLSLSSTKCTLTESSQPV